MKTYRFTFEFDDAAELAYAYTPSHGGIAFVAEYSALAQLAECDPRSNVTTEARLAVLYSVARDCYRGNAFGTPCCDITPNMRRDRRFRQVFKQLGFLTAAKFNNARKSA